MLRTSPTSDERAEGVGAARVCPARTIPDRALRSTHAPGRCVKRLLLLALLAVSPQAPGNDWTLLSSDDLSATYLDKASLSRNASNEVLFRIRLAYKRKRDMMGLFSDSATRDYVLACDARLVVSMQHLLWEGDEIVWTFPRATEKVRADRELPAELISRLCG